MSEQKFAEGTAVKVIAILTIKPDSPYYKSDGSASLDDLLNPHGISISYDVEQRSTMEIDDDELVERMADRAEAMRYG